MESSPDENSDEDSGFSSVVLRLFLSGHWQQLAQPSINEMSSYSNAEQPDTVQQSDIKQNILNKLSKLSSSTPDRNIVSSLMLREISCCGVQNKASFSTGYCANIATNFIPNKVVKKQPHSQKLFCGTYSIDGKVFLSACQDGYLRLYHSSDLSKSSHPFKTLPANDIGWSILDTAFSADALYMSYSTWSNNIFLASVHDDGDQSLSLHKSLNLHPDTEHNFAVFSLQFSDSNNEILCGASDQHVYIYDLMCNQRILSIMAQDDDVNAVCFADASSQILYSGGDDGLINTWDRRCLSETNPSTVGSFAGHLDGITYIDSHSDGRYLISNSKDQTIKLWDLRKFSSRAAQENVKKVVSCQSWDYRWQQPPSQCARRRGIEGDSSLKTYHGHKVTNTLIRARFSPLHTTGEKFIYTGCSSGHVVIYDILTGDIVSKRKEQKSCVRDVSWHPHEQTLVSSSWDGTFAVWEYDSNRETPKSRIPSGDEETGERQHSRRSPRLARSGR